MNGVFAPSRAQVLAGTAAFAAALGGVRVPGSAAYPAPEKTSLKIGTAVNAMSFLPVYIAAAKTWKAQGLDVQIFTFRGDAEVAQALVGNSIDVSYQSLNGFINMISAGQPVMGFYGGFWQADFTWLAQPDIKHWSDVRGKQLGVATYGSLTDALTRYALKRNKIDADRDVQIVQAGSTPSSFQALKSNKLTATILSPPFSWEAQDAGFTVLGTQAADVSKQWPKHLIGASTAFIAANPHTCEALLRGHVAAIRLARSNRDAVVPVLMEQLQLTKDYAERALAVELPFYDERGSMPEASMPVFWDITKQLGDVQSPWPETKYLDHRFINSFKAWAP